MNKYVRRFSHCLLACALACVSCSQHDEDVMQLGHVSYPVAEYQKAKVVLVCEPGEEFNFAGSNQEGIAQEYQAFVSLLEKNDIEVCNLREAFWEVKQFKTKEMHSMVYVRDPLIATPCGIIMGKMKNSTRSEEPSLTALTLRSMGLTPAYRVSGDEACLEGGDYLPMGTFCLIGCGVRTNLTAIRELMQADVLGVDTVVVVNDRSGNMREMHLDTYLNAIDQDLMTLTCERYDAGEEDEEFLSVDVYVRQHGSRPYTKAFSGQPLLTFFNGRGIHVIRISEFDTLMLGGNYLCIGPRHIIASEGLSAEFYNTLTEYGVKTDVTPTVNIRIGKGGIHCVTQVISRE